MGNIRCMVLLLMSLQMWIKLSQYYHVYSPNGVIIVFQVTFGIQIILYVKKCSSKYGDGHLTRFN